MNSKNTAKGALAQRTTHVILEPLELMEKLAALVPAPRANLIHFRGVVAPAAKWRTSIVPGYTDTGATAPECDGNTGPLNLNA